MQKTLFRQKIINERLSLSGKDVLERSIAIEKQLIGSSLYKNAVSVALYCDFRGEVKTDLIVRDVLTSGKSLLLPKIKEEDFSISFIAVRSEDELAENAIGFREPLVGKGRRWEVEDIDLFIVPGVAFDKTGNRLGMGKGCYDRVLAHTKRENIVALAYEFQLVDEVPSYHHDIKVGWIITEKRFIRTLENN